MRRKTHQLTITICNQIVNVAGNNRFLPPPKRSKEDLVNFYNNKKLRKIKKTSLTYFYIAEAAIFCWPPRPPACCLARSLKSAQAKCWSDFLNKIAWKQRKILDNFSSSAAAAIWHWKWLLLTSQENPLGWLALLEDSLLSVGHLG